MAACVITSCLEKEGREKYLIKNKEISLDVLNVLDCIHYCLQKELRINLNQQDLHNEMMPPDLVDEV